MVVPVILNGTPAVITTCSVSSASPSANAARTALTTASLKRVLLPDRTQFVPQVKARRLAVPISDDNAMIGTRGRSLAVSSAVVPVYVKQQMALMSVVSAISRAADTIPSATEFLLALLEASMTSV